MTYLQSFVLGIVQGLTEFLPVSSSGHLIIVPALFGWPEHTLAFDTTLHLGTAVAVLAYFYKDLVAITKSIFSDVKSKGFNFASFSNPGQIGLKIGLASVPAALLGLVFDDAIEAHTRGVFTVVVFSFLGTLLMLLAEYKLYFLDTDEQQEEAGLKVLNKKLGVGKALMVGLFQALALLPGVSRSGSTISAGAFAGLNREQAARYSFLMSMPIVFAAAVFKILSSARDGSFIFDGIMATGLIASALSGILAIKILLEFLKTKKLHIFIVYRVILILLLIGFYI